MRPAAEIFAPFFIESNGAGTSVPLRVARFEADAPRAVCLVLNGQTEFIEKYFEVIDDLLRRGFSVATLDWRGQGGSGRLTANPRKAHIDDFGQYDADLDAVIRQVVKPMQAGLPRGAKPLIGGEDGSQAGRTPVASLAMRRAEGELKVIALAHSMGGHILLRRLHDRQKEFSAVALCAPMIGIQPRGVPWWMVAAMARLLNRRAPSRNFVWGMAGRDHVTLPFERQIVTSDPMRYRRSQEMLAAHPELSLNGPTWGWLAAALQSITLLHASGYAESIQTPALFFAAGKDRICNSDALHAFAARMPQADCVTVVGAEHEILMERDVLRDQLWAAFDVFMNAKAPRL